MLDKAIEHGKEKRKPYRGAKSIDLHCRNHGSCSHCMKNRNYKNMKRLQSALEQERAKLYFETKFWELQGKRTVYKSANKLFYIKATTKCCTLTKIVPNFKTEKQNH